MTETAGKTHAMRAVIELRQRILAGDIPGGTRLFEVPLAEELQISRTPVREAMSRLAEEGLLERVRNGGFMVRSFSFADVIDTLELRAVLEGTAARLAAERGVEPERLAEIREILVRLDACFGETPEEVDFEGYSELNVEFHTALAGLPGSDMVRREVERAKRLPFASPSAFLPGKTDIAAFKRTLVTGQEQHRAIVEAITAREGTRAEALVREHARAARRNVEFIMAEPHNLAVQMPGLALVVG